MTPLDLDHNAGSPLRPAALAAMAAVAGAGNPASAHAAGRAARRLLEDARERVAARLGAFPDEVIFTSGATEANNLACAGLFPGKPVACSAIEHPCVLDPLKRRGVSHWLPVDACGRADPSAAPPEALTALMLANHETGAVQRVEAVRGPLLCDAAQAVGRVPVHFHRLGAAALTASGHKFGGPVGVGLLLLKRGTPFAPAWLGGHQQGGRRPGTESVLLAVGLAAALDEACDRPPADVRRRFVAGLPEAVLNGPPLDDPGALPNTVNLSFPGRRTDLLLMALDLAGVRASGGSACASGSLLPSPVLTAMGLDEGRVRSAVRFSFGPDATAEDADEAARRVAACVRRLT